MKAPILKNLAFAAVGIAIVSGCHSGSSSNGTATKQGQLSFNYNGELQVSSGSVQQVALVLNNSNNITAQQVKIISDNEKLATVSPTSCTVSSDDPVCVITVNGKNKGKVNIDGVASGYQSVRLQSNVINGPVYGYLGVESSVFSTPYPLGVESNPSPFVVHYSSYESQSLPALNDMPAGKYYTLYVTGGLLYSSGINSNDNVIFNVAPESNIFSSSGYGYHANRQGAEQCNVTSTEPLCELVFYVPVEATNHNLPVTLNSQIAGSLAPHYSQLDLKALPDNKAYPGVINLGYQSQNIPLNMHGPVFLNWNKVAMNGNVSIQLTSNSGNVQFYNYDVLHNTAVESLSSTVTCNLQFPQNAAVGSGGASGVSCGFGVKGVSIGQATISATIISQNVNGYTKPYQIAPIQLNVVNQDSFIRQITVTNKSSESIFLGVTTGGANSYINPKLTAFVPNSVSSQVLKPGGGSMCGPSNSFAACPVGSTCMPGGLNPESKSAYFCYYDAPEISNYIMLPNGSATISISNSSGASDPSGIIWSGNFFARTGCTESGLCDNGTCGKNGLACSPGTGGAPGVMTLSEATFQRNGSPDYYDVSIINGLNFATEFGPVVNEAENYFCGTAGSFSEQTSGVHKLPASDWSITPNSTNSVYAFPLPANVQGESASYFRWVSYNPAKRVCTTSESCLAGDKCGFVIQTDKNGASITDNTIPINESTASYTRYCGKPIAWLTADTIYGFESNATGVNTLPFNLTQTFSVSIPGQNVVTVGNLQLCNMNTYSAYGAQPAEPYGNLNLSCGGVNWENLNITTYVTGAPQTINPNWESNVQPTITWLKQTCPTCYTFPYDDLSSTFTCVGSKSYSINMKDPPIL